MTVIERIKKEIDSAKNYGFLIEEIHVGSGVWDAIIRNLNVAIGVTPTENELKLGLVRIKLADFVGYENIRMYGSKCIPIVDRMLNPLP